MLHDMRFTAAQLRAAGDWCEPELADVELFLDHGVLVVEQGDEQAMFAADGSDKPACKWCGRAEAAHVKGQQPEPHEFDTFVESIDPAEIPGVTAKQTVADRIAGYGRELIDPDYDPAAEDEDGVPLFSNETAGRPTDDPRYQRGAH